LFEVTKQEIIIVKRLIQGRNKGEEGGNWPKLCDYGHGCRKNGAL